LSTVERFHESAQGIDGLRIRIVEHAREFDAQRHETLVDQHVEQLVASLEVVVNHRRRDARLARDRAERRFTDALPREQRKGDIQQLFTGLLAVRAARAPGFLARRRTRGRARTSVQHIVCHIRI
jgi:hypothetical protein